MTIQMNTAVSTPSNTDGKPESNTPDLSSASEETRTYIGNLQRENAELKKSPTNIVDAQKGTEQNISSTDTGKVNDGLSADDLSLGITDKDKDSFSVSALKQEINTTGKISESSVDILKSALKGGMNETQQGEVVDLIKGNIESSHAATAVQFKEILGDIDFLKTLKPWARKQPRYQEWERDFKTTAWPTVLREMTAQYKTANPAAAITDNSPTSIGGEAGAGLSNVETKPIDTSTPESRGFFNSRKDKADWMRANGHAYNRDPNVRANYEKMLAASQAKKLI